MRNKADRQIWDADNLNDESLHAATKTCGVNDCVEPNLHVLHVLHGSNKSKEVEIYQTRRQNVKV